VSAVDFEAWATPPLVLTLAGHTYTVDPPTVGAMRQVLAAAVRGEVNLGLVIGPVPDEVQAVLDAMAPDEHPALGHVWHQMADDGQARVTIDRMAYYAVFYWARGKEYADALAAQLWTPRDVEEPTERTGGAAPKGSSRRRTGRPTASANPTPTAGTRTTDPSPPS